MRGLLLVSVFLFLFVVTLGALVYADANSWSKKVDVSSLLGKDEERPDTPKEENPTDSYAGKDLNIVLIASDHRDNVEYDERGYKITGMRSDATLVMHIAADRKRIDIISIPRDTMVKRPECKNSAGKVFPASTQLGMFNDSFALAGGENDVAAAAACTIKTVEGMSNVYVDQFVVVDFAGFKGVIDALGGVNMCLDKAVHDRKNTVNLPAGCQKLDSEQALGYARARYGLGDGSDLSRIGRQQQLLGAIMKEALSKNYLTDLPSLYSFLRAGMKSLTMSEEFGSVTTLGGLALSMSGIDPSKINFYMLPVEDYPYNRAKVIPAPAAEGVWEAIRSDKPLAATVKGTNIDGKEAKPVEPPATATESNPDSVGITPTPSAPPGTSTGN